MKAVWEVIAVALLTVILLAAVHTVMCWMGSDGCDPYRIDDNRPGADITGEGP